MLLGPVTLEQGKKNKPIEEGRTLHQFALFFNVTGKRMFTQLLASISLSLYLSFSLLSFLILWEPVLHCFSERERRKVTGKRVGLLARKRSCWPKERKKTRLIFVHCAADVSRTRIFDREE